MFKKSLAIAVVAMFCVSALFVLADTDDSSAAGESTLTYSFYLELKDGTNSYSARLPDVTINSTEYTGDNYQTALTQACAAAGLSVTFGSYNMVSSIVAGGNTYEASGSWGGDDYYNFAVYYSENGQWKSSYLNDAGVLVIVFDLYKFTQPAEASAYLENGEDPYKYWTLLPTVGHPVEYQVYFQLHDSDESSYSVWTKTIQFGISGDSLKNARLVGAAQAGFEITNSSGATSITSITAGGHTYAKHGSYGGDEYYNYAAYYADGNKWVDLQAVNLDTATTIVHVFDIYKFSDPQDSSYYYHAPAYGMDAYWTKAPTEAVPGSGSSSGGDDNTILIVGAAAIAIAVVIAAVFAVMAKKH